MKGRNPRTPAEWQEAVDAATAARLVADCDMYGLITGGPSINVARCDYIVKRGAAMGVTPSRDAVLLAVEFIEAVNAEERNGA